LTCLWTAGKREGGNFVAATTSPRGEWLYCLGEDNVLYCFSMASSKLEHLMPVADSGAIGLAHHPHRNQVATYADEGMLQLWIA
jgi:WD40 repeat-containing protein SMU1